MKTVKYIKSIALVLATSALFISCNEQATDQAAGGSSQSSKVSALKALLADPNLFQEALAQANSLNSDPDYTLTADELSFLLNEGLLTAQEAEQLSVLVAHN